jgi:predicted aminopeptidase
MNRGRALWLVPLLGAVAVVTAGGIAAGGPYLLEQGVYAAHYTFGAESIHELRRAADVGGETVAFFDRVERIRRFARRELGLEPSDNYTTYAQIEGDHLVYVVSAARELSFERYHWWYPLLGRLPYRGYYERADALAEAARISADGWDVLVRGVDAYSSLGFVADPLYSFMRDYSEHRLAELLIHELAHATIFVPGEASFNEELATLVGREGALAYLRERHSASSAEYLRAVRRLRDRRVFLGFVAALRNRLEAVYESDLPPEQKRAEKARIIAESRSAAARYSDRWFLSEAFDWVAEADIDNAFIDLYVTYNAGRMSGYGDESSVLEQAFRQVGRSVPALIEAVRDVEDAGDPAAALSESLGFAPQSDDE